MPRISRIKLCIPVFQELTYGTYKKFKKNYDRASICFIRNADPHLLS